MDAVLKTLVYKNACALKEQEEDGFEDVDFLVKEGERLIMPQRIIGVMMDLDLIEKEEERYFLTEKGYALADGELTMEKEEEIETVFTSERVKNLKVDYRQLNITALLFVSVVILTILLVFLFHE